MNNDYNGKIKGARSTVSCAVRDCQVTDVSASSDCDSLARVGGRVPRPPLYILNYFNMLDAPRWLALSPLAGHCIELRQRHHMQATL